MAALPAFSHIAFNYVDAIVIVWLLVGILRGRKRGMTQELLPSTQWILIAVVAGLCYSPVSGLLFQITGGNFNHLWSNITAYILIAFGIHMIFLWLKDATGDHLTGSDLFGKSEYYLGMAAGLLRFACMFIVLVALLHSRIYTEAELAASAKEQRRNFEDIRFPTYGSVQHGVLTESFTGHWVQENLHQIMITTTNLPHRSEAITQRRDDINAILGAPKK